MTTPLRANSVEVVKIHRAHCRLGGCPWAGPDRQTYQDANGDRQRHMDWHRLNPDSRWGQSITWPSPGPDGTGVPA